MASTKKIRMKEFNGVDYDVIHPEIASLIDADIGVSPDVAAALGLTGNPQVKDALAKLAVGIDKYGYYLTVKFADGKPAVGITVSGLNKADGTACITDNNGNVLGVSTSASVTINISGFIDVQPFSQQITSTDIITQVLVTLTDITATMPLTFTTSQNIKFSRDVLVDIHVVGGGHSANSVFGGADGKQRYQLGVKITKNTVKSIQIGANGGGDTSFAGISSVSGVNNAGGGATANGISATVRLFGTGSIVAGGSGGGASTLDGKADTVGGYPHGGGSKSAKGEDATGFGGGGGGSGASSFGQGYQGVLFIRWRLA